MGRKPPAERLSEAAQTVEDVASEVRSGDHAVEHNRDRLATLAMRTSVILRDMAEKFDGEGDHA